MLISFECQHRLRNRRKSKNGYAATKIDISKAYDRVELGCLEAVIRHMGFPERIINLIIRCVTSVSSSFLLNRNVYGEIKSSRGFRQGDPMSSFLFVICAQSFSSFIHKFERDGRITCVPIIPQELSISDHLIIADDKLRFFKADGEEARATKEVLQLNEIASGQLINFIKSSV